MGNWFFLFFIFILSLFQAVILDFQLFNVKPDFMLISVAIAAFYLDLKWVLILGTFAGLLKDSLGVTAFGVNTLLFPSLGFVMIKLAKKISVDNNFVRITVIFIMGFFGHIIARVIFFFLDKINIALFAFLRLALLESLYTALVSPLLFRVARPILRLQNIKI